MEVEQVLKTPEAYLLQLLASTVTDTGRDMMAFWRLEHPLAELKELILKEPPCCLQLPSVP